MKHKIIDWIKRYAPAEIFGVIGALLGAWLVFLLTNNRILAAYAGTITDNIGYYGFILIREHVNDYKQSKLKRKKHGMLGFSKTFRNLFLEFGFAEFLDFFIVRPFCLYIFPILLNNYGLGIIIGVTVANIIFYFPTIIAYELRKKHLG